jgi:hypothetical protein
LIYFCALFIDDKSEVQEKCIDIMRLAMKWNKVEIAKQTVEYLDKNYSYFYCDDYYNLMETALTDNRLDFFGYYMNEFRYVKDFRLY